MSAPAQGGHLGDRDRTLETMRSLLWQRRKAILSGAGAAKEGPRETRKDAVKELGVILENLDRDGQNGLVVPPFSRLRRPLRVLARRLARGVLGMLQPVVRNQRDVNRAVGDALAGLSDTTERQLARLEERLREHEATLAEVEGKLGAVAALQERSSPSLLARVFDVVSFDEAMRGTDDELRERLRRYVPLFEGRSAVLDVACGRGMFLDLLREAGVGARGVDLDPRMVERARARGLDVERSDALQYLHRAEDRSFDGVFCCQFVEHLGVPEVVDLIDCFSRKLRPGGTLVIETLHPECLQVLYRWFWVDPSHQRLVHPITLAYLLENRGFRDIETHVLRPVPEREVLPPLPSASFAPELAPEIEAFNRGTAEVNRLLFGSPEYYVRAVR
jgi:SAM-dependent methyltransferase